MSNQKNLFIIESPGKSKKIKKILGNNFEVYATKGHVADLPENKIGVDIKNNFEPYFEVSEDKKNLFEEIKKKIQKADNVYLATDLDREGEGISSILADKTQCHNKAKRIRYSSITKKEILSAIDQPEDIDNNLVSAFEARRILDRLAGYKTSSLIKSATGGPSAGRTQSAGLRILADREKAIQEFVPQIYWHIEADLLCNESDKITATIKKPKPLDISTEEYAGKICDTIKEDKIEVSKYDVKEVSSKPYAPFTTSTIYQSAASAFGWDSSKTAKIAQNLYNESFISYMRTDSVYIVPSFIDEIRDTIQSSFGNNYLPQNSYKYSNSGNSQEAHEACRVIDLSTRECHIGPDESKLYDLIWRRTVASQMAKSKDERITAEFSCENETDQETYTLGVNGSRQLFEGWKKVWHFSQSDDVILPQLQVGDPVDLEAVRKEQKETSPPSRYTKASFQKKLEQEGIGRPSTYANIAKTLTDRGYIESKKNIKVTDLGIKVNDFMVSADFCFVDTSFTSQMEDQLDQVAKGQMDKKEVLQSFWERLKKDIESAKNLKQQQSKTSIQCPKCQENNIEAYLVKKYSRYGPFFACENWSSKENKCEHKVDADENEQPAYNKETSKQYSEYPCPKCSGNMLLRKNKRGNYFYGCENYSKTGCGGIRAEDGTEVKKKKTSKKKKKSKKKSQNKK